MTQELEPIRNSAAYREFENWKDGALENLNQVAAALIEEQLAMVDAMVTDPNIEFRVKLKLLSMHAGEEDICYTAGFSREIREGWIFGSDVPSPERQILILSLCKSIVFEALDTSSTLNHLVNVIGESKIAESVSAAALVETVPLTLADCLQYDDLPFDPAEIIPFEHYSTRVSNCFKTLGLQYVGQLVSCYEKELLCVPNFAKASAREVREVIANVHGASLGMKHPALDKFLKDHPLPASISNWRR